MSIHEALAVWDQRSLPSPTGSVLIPTVTEHCGMPQTPSAFHQLCSPGNRLHSAGRFPRWCQQCHRSALCYRGPQIAPHHSTLCLGLLRASGLGCSPSGRSLAGLMFLRWKSVAGANGGVCSWGSSRGSVLPRSWWLGQGYGPSDSFPFHAPASLGTISFAMSSLASANVDNGVENPGLCCG